MGRIVPPNANLFSAFGNNPITYTDPDGSDIKSVAIAFGKGMWDAAVDDAKGFVNTVAHPIQTAKNIYNGIKNEVTELVADAPAYFENKVNAVKAGFNDFIEATNEERAYVIGGITENVVVTVTTAKAVKTVNAKIKGPTAKPSELPGGCFVAGTLVAVENGFVPIEQINIGDYVLSYEDDTGYVVLQKIVNTFVREKKFLVIVRTDESEIVTTEEHPFYVERKGWTEAGKLFAGAKLKCADGSTVTAKSVCIKRLEEPIFVYNFEVENTHNYFVSDEKILVHNNCKSSGIGKNTRRMTDTEVDSFMGEKNWHRNSKLKKNYANKFSNELKGDTNPDFYIDTKTGEVYLKGLNKGQFVNTGEVFE